MSDLLFEPYAVQQQWTMPTALQPAEWTALFTQYLAQLAEACEKAGQEKQLQVVIGHIKLLALFNENQYLRVSAVRAGDGPTVSGVVPPEQSEVETTLNVLVYGLPRELIAAQAAVIAAALVGQRDGTVQSKRIIEVENNAH